MADDDKPKKRRPGRPKSPVTEMMQEQPKAKAKGGARTGAGRKKQERLNVIEILDGLAFNPFEELVRVYRDPGTSNKDKIHIATDLAQYVAPKLKHTDLKIADGESLVTNMIRQLQEQGRPKPPTEGQ